VARDERRDIENVSGMERDEARGFCHLLSLVCAFKIINLYIDIIY
jgi:hypothetical protein